MGTQTRALESTTLRVVLFLLRLNRGFGIYFIGTADAGSEKYYAARGTFSLEVVSGVLDILRSERRRGLSLGIVSGVWDILRSERRRAR